MVTFLFWNVKRKRLDDRVARMAVAHSADVVVLAEYLFPPTGLIERMTAAGAGEFRCVSPPRAALRVFTRQPDVIWELRENRTHFQMYRVRRSDQPRTAAVIVVVAHLGSKLHGRQPGTQRVMATRLAERLAAEEAVQNAGAVVFGDLNMNPFEPGVAGIDGLHGVPSRRKAQERARRLDRQTYPMLYNPMWGLFGDRDAPRPAGTYYRAAAEEVCYFWNVYDQVLVRPALMSRLWRVTILHTDGEQSLLTRAGLPDARTASDHLPLLFDLDTQGAPG